MPQTYEQLIAELERDEAQARKNGIKRICAGYYLILGADGVLYQVERGDRREMEGADRKMWFVSTDEDGVVSEWMTLTEAKWALAQPPAPEAEVEEVEAEDETPAVSAPETKVGENLYQIEATVEAVFADMDNEDLVYIRVTRDSAPKRGSKLKFTRWTFRIDVGTNPYQIGDRVRLTIHINPTTGLHTTRHHELIIDTDDDAPWQTIYTGPYTIHTDTDSMTFEWRSEAEEMADLLTANGARITLDWNYRPITIGEIVGINVKSYTPSPRWAVIGVMRNRLGLIVYLLQNEDGVTQQYYGLSILRLQPNTYHVPVVDILTVDIATAHLAEYMVNMHNMHPLMCNAMHDDLMSDMLDDLLDAKWREVTKRMHATHTDDAPERLEMMFEYEAFAEWVDARKMTLEYATAYNQKHPL